MTEHKEPSFMNSNEHVASVAQLNLDLEGGDSSVLASKHTKRSALLAAVIDLSVQVWLLNHFCGCPNCSSHSSELCRQVLVPCLALKLFLQHHHLVCADRASICFAQCRLCLVSP